MNKKFVNFKDDLIKPSITDPNFINSVFSKVNRLITFTHRLPKVAWCYLTKVTLTNFENCLIWRHVGTLISTLPLLISGLLFVFAYLEGISLIISVRYGNLKLYRLQERIQVLGQSESLQLPLQVTFNQLLKVVT